MRLIILFAAIWSAYLTAEEPLPSLVDLSRSPIPRVAGSVNLVSGNYIDQAARQETSGIDPYTVGTCYVSSNGSQGSLAYGWDFYHATTLTVQKTDTEKVYLTFKDGCRATYVFYGLLSSEGKYVCMGPMLDDTGYTLIGSIKEPVRRNIKRAKVMHTSTEDIWKIRLGEGTKRMYNEYRIKESIHPWIC